MYDGFDSVCRIVDSADFLGGVHLREVLTLRFEGRISTRANVWK